jgi:hypothetical protein
LVPRQGSARQERSREHAGSGVQQRASAADSPGGSPVTASGWDALAEAVELTRRLKLPHIRRRLVELVPTARTQRWDHRRSTSAVLPPIRLHDLPARGGVADAGRRGAGEGGAGDAGPLDNWLAPESAG